MSSFDTQSKRLNHIISDASQQGRVTIDLNGRFMTPDHQEYPCRIVAMSSNDMQIEAGQGVAPNSKIVAYIDEIGRIEGNVLEWFGNGFIMSVQTTEVKRKRLAAQLTWIANRGPLGLVDQRGGDRHPPKNPMNKLTLSDQVAVPVRIADVSPSGVRLLTPLRPEIGSPAMIGRVRGTVVRHTEDGIALRFANMLLDDSQI